MRELEGKRVLVTGAGKGIGRGIALALAKAGAKLLLHYRSNPAEAESLRKDIPEAAFVQADLSLEEGIKKLFSEVENTLGGLDAAVNNAGWDPGFVPLENIDFALYHKLSDMNIRGTLFCCLREIALMKKNGSGGSIMNIGSVQQDTSVLGRTLYATSKGAIHAMTGQLALEAGRFGIRVNNIAPGYIEVDRMANAPGYDRVAVEADIPLGRVGTPSDVGELAVFLASDKSSFITGQSLFIDGGVSRKLARSGIRYRDENGNSKAIDEVKALKIEESFAKNLSQERGK